MSRLGRMLAQVQGEDSLASFSRTLDLSYTFVRSLVNGTRHPSDPVVKKIARRLGLEHDHLLLAAHCDRSPDLTAVLRSKGIDVDRLVPTPAMSLNGSASTPRSESDAADVRRPSEVQHTYGERF